MAVAHTGFIGQRCDRWALGMFLTADTARKCRGDRYSAEQEGKGPPGGEEDPRGDVTRQHSGEPLGRPGSSSGLGFCLF